MLHTGMRFSAAELAEDLGCSPRDVIDMAHDSGCIEFEIDGESIDYADFDRLDDVNFNRGPASLDDVEIVIDDPAAVRFAYVAGVEL
jgi:hypothetical protein